MAFGIIVRSASQLINTHLTGVHLIRVYLTGIYLISVHLTGVYLMGVHLIGILRAVKVQLACEYMIFENALIAECASDCSDLRGHRRPGIFFLRNSTP